MLNLKDLKPGDRVKYTEWFVSPKPHPKTYGGINLGDVLTIDDISDLDVRFREFPEDYHIHVDIHFTKIDKFDKRKARLCSV